MVEARRAMPCGSRGNAASSAAVRRIAIFAIFRTSVGWGLSSNGACDNDMNTTPPNTGEFGQRAAPPRLIVPKSANEALRPEAGTPPPRRSRQSRNQIVVFLNFIVTALIFGVIAGGVLAYYGKQQFEAPGPSTSATTVMIKPNTGIQEIGDQLRAARPDHRRPHFLDRRQRLSAMTVSSRPANTRSRPAPPCTTSCRS